MERTLNLNDKTTINLFAVLGVLPVFIGFVFWMSTTWADVVNIKTALAEKNKQDIKESEKRIESLTSQIHKTNEESKGTGCKNQRRGSKTDDN